MRPERRSAVLGACALVATVCGCTGVMRPALDAANPPGQLNAQGKIEPCHGYQSRPQECGNAIFNSSRIGKVDVGHSLQDVREIMGHDPEEREVRAEDGHAIEVWGYLTDYVRSTKSVISFKDGKVVSIERKRR